MVRLFSNGCRDETIIYYNTFLSFQLIWVDDVVDELDTALGKLKTTVSKIDFYFFNQFIIKMQF